MNTERGKPRVMYYSNSILKVNGSRTHAIEFSRELKYFFGEDKCIILPRNSKDLKKSNIKGLNYLKKIRFIPKPHIITLILSAIRLYNVLKKYNHESQILILRHDSYFLLYPVIKVFLCKNLIIEFNSSLYSESWANIRKQNMFMIIERFCISKSALISGVSTELLKPFIESKSKYVVNPNGVNLQLYEFLNLSEANDNILFEQDFQKHGPKFIYVGGSEAFRKLEETFLILSEVVEKLEIPSSLLIVGDVKLKPTVREELEQCTFLKCLFVGFVESVKVPQLMKKANIGLFPFSNNYGSPQKIFEYAAADLFIFGPNVPPIYDGGFELIDKLVNQNNDDYRRVLYETLLSGSWQNPIDKKPILQQKYTWKHNLLRILAELDDKYLESNRG